MCTSLESLSLVFLFKFGCLKDGRIWCWARASFFRSATNGYCNFQTSVGCVQSCELDIMISSILKLQRWWRSVLLFKLRTKSAIVIQSCLRGWIDRQRAAKQRQSIVMIQVRMLQTWVDFFLIALNGMLHVCCENEFLGIAKLTCTTTINIYLLYKFLQTFSSFGNILGISSFSLTEFNWPSWWTL